MDVLWHDRYRDEWEAVSKPLSVNAPPSPQAFQAEGMRFASVNDVTPRFTQIFLNSLYIQNKVLLQSIIEMIVFSHEVSMSHHMPLIA